MEKSLPKLQGRYMAACLLLVLSWPGNSKEYAGASASVDKGALSHTVSPVIAAITVHGTILDETNQPMPGVNVVVKGSAVGVNTDGDGHFTLEVPDENAVLVISFIGYSREEVAVGDKTEFTITLTPDISSLDEVVVTAFGIKKEKKAVTYAVTEVHGEVLTKSREVNLGNAMVGRVAGLNATSTATGPSGSSRVVIRGNGSLNGNNQPLYIVNGVPVTNANQGSAGTFGGIDRGDGLSSINPDDIETITVLKGGTAAALYGSRAANGVIMITTKSGAAQKGLGVEYNSTYTWETPRNLTDWQYEYGSGSQGKAPTTQAEAISAGRMSWGAKLDGSQVVQPDGVSRPYSAEKDNIKNFYNTGHTFTNTVALSGGNDVANFRFSASNLDNKGIVPNNSLNRKTFNLSANATLAKKVTFDAKVQYSVEETKNRTFTADFQKNPNAGAQLIGTNIDVRILDPGYDEKGNEVLWNDYIYSTNPYFAVNRVKNGDTRRRLISSFSTRYNITEWLYVRGRLGIDQFNFDAQNIEPTGIAFNNRGSMTTDQNVNQEVNAEALIGFSKNFGVFSVNALAGGNQMKTQTEGLNLSSGFFNVPYQYFIGNGSAQTFNKSFGETAINSLFGSADIGYKNILFLTLTGRKDWFSTLTQGDNENYKFYPSAGVGFVFSDAFEAPAWLSFGKLRASWARVGGGATDPYALALAYTAQPQQHLGATLMTITNSTIPNALEPYTSTTRELGLESRLFEGKIGFDVTVYNRTTTDDIVNASVPLSSGYSAVSLNVGEMENKGIELLVSGTPVQKDAFTWDVSYNLAYNKNTVVNISEGLTSLFLPGATTRTQNGGIYHFEGEPFGVIAGNRMKRDADGNIIYNSATGIPVQGPLEILGRGVPPVTMGLTNNVRYKNFTLNVLVDGKFGAQVYSATNAYATQFGLHKNTAANGVRETGVKVTGVNQIGEPYSGTVSAQTYYSTIWSTITDQFVTDADFIKLRSVTLTYALPKDLLAKTPFQSASLSFVSRNLFILYNSADNIDPESSYSNGNAQGLENFGLPTTRSYGFNLLVKF
ncbi:SusC/RagA family TonB-linked outer membrane protein [Parachryseolinea silvisoli]|jgi:TonB-linked SusC/RagA family outer membrane protein|uniref:SusC/RagA family TonB-linked outer membrane protein n=1 Tax=Parachryseolinea silvisoli TaxID=2873601 RepID=UPI002265A385|nr:SusC/RagA family TonB-linked outer membrane protein [Parachryseolinea silvisoli]MCD9019306.1 SusC/RagA family TonB-linked outer membrane protein [Parachryseolinea silvisoli]